MLAHRLTRARVGLFEPWNYQWRFRFELAVADIVIRQRKIKWILSRSKSDRNVVTTRRCIGIVIATIVGLPIEIPAALEIWNRIIAAGLLPNPEHCCNNVCFPGEPLSRRA